MAHRSALLTIPFSQSLHKLLPRQRIVLSIHPRHTLVSLFIAIPQEIPTITVQWRIRIGILQQIPGSPTKPLERPRRDPLILDDIQTHLASLPMDIRVEYPRLEVEFRRYYWVLLCEGDFDFEDAL